ncbi:MAG: glycosyl transferase, partial [Clostridiaceae bacterium]|nr:glycosyl transferase [Clostridiaceae bacterium]
MPTYVVLAGIAILFALVLVLDRKGKRREVEISDAILGPDELKSHAIGIARNHIVGRRIGALKWLLSRMDGNYRVIAQTYKVLNNEVRKNLPVPPAAEWLLDNFYIIEEEFRDIKQSVNWRTFPGLPVLRNGYLRGYPRIFAIALEIVSHTDGRLDENTIINFIEAYQTQKILSTEEFWALPAMIRIALMENLRQICSKMINTIRQWRRAEETSKTVKNNPDKGKEEILWFLNEYGKHGGEIYSSFIEHILKILKKQGKMLLPVIKYIDEKLADQGLKSDNVAAFEHQVQAALQVSIGNSLTSLKFVQSIDWNEIFESLSYVEEILKRDPANVYMKMDSKSKNHYRNSVSKLARICNVSEGLISIKALECAQEWEEHEKCGGNHCQEGSCQESQNREIVSRRSPRNHIGYYILGKGRDTLLKKINCRAVGIKHPEEVIKKHPALFYLGLIMLLTLTITLLLTLYAMHALDTLNAQGGLSALDSAYSPYKVDVYGRIKALIIILLTIIVVIIPASEISIAIVNFIVSRICSPSILPKLELKEGIPCESSTMVIVPTLLPNEKRVRELLEQLEVHYHANRENNVYFALVGDFKDAASKNLPEDEKIIDIAIKGITELNRRYAKNGEDIFFYFHRERQYNKVQKRWMGWERKRGAIIELNDLLRGSTETSYNIISCEISAIPYVKYVVTLDADTKLPIGTVKTLVGTIMHPMNKAVVDREKGIVTEGHGIFQPRININITSVNVSLFTRIFAGQGGIDPYTTAVSDVYQDLFGEGIFTGKGIYELDVFQEVLKESIPENSILSHDLLEGCYARACLVTDVDLVDGYPSKYNSYSMRLHRWVRGDWQVIPWLGRMVRDRKGNLTRNPLSATNKWKILDNLRRSLVPPSLLFLVVFGFTLLPGSIYAWLGFAVLAIAINPLIHMAYGLLTGNYFRYMRGRYAKGMKPEKASMYQVLLQFVFIPYQAYLMLDAILRTLVRLGFTRKNMLEWVTAADAEASLSNDAKSFFRRMWMSSAIGTAFLLGTVYLNPGGVPAALVISLPWIGAFYIAYFISKPYVRKVEKPGMEDILLLRRIARRTWRYFEDMVTEKDNCLPPDNYQEEPYKGIARRTSPTNIGLMMASVACAKDLGYIGLLEMKMWFEKVLPTMEKLEKWEGHLYNWYNTNSLKVMRPAYVSTVDSGNFVCYLMVASQALEDALNSSPLNTSLAWGLKDMLGIIKEEAQNMERDANVYFDAYNGFFNAVTVLEEKIDAYLDKNNTSKAKFGELIDGKAMNGEVTDVIQWKELLETGISITRKYMSNRKINYFSWLHKVLLTAEIYKKELFHFYPLARISDWLDEIESKSLDMENRQIIEDFIYKVFREHGA